MLTDEQLKMLIDSYGLEELLDLHNIEQEYVLKLLIEERLFGDLEEEYFGEAAYGERGAI